MIVWCSYLVVSLRDWTQKGRACNTHGDEARRFIHLNKTADRFLWLPTLCWASVWWKYLRATRTRAQSQSSMTKGKNSALGNCGGRKWSCTGEERRRRKEKDRRAAGRRYPLLCGALVERLWRICYRPSSSHDEYNSDYSWAPDSFLVTTTTHLERNLRVIVGTNFGGNCFLLSATGYCRLLRIRS